MYKHRANLRTPAKNGKQEDGRKKATKDRIKNEKTKEEARRRNKQEGGTKK